MSCRDSFVFEVVKRDGLGRVGLYHLPHGVVETPALLPVVNPNIDFISPKEMEKEFGIRMLITNSYIIYKKEETRRKALEEGIHKLIDFSGNIMTDSGTFQNYVYGDDVKIDPVEIILFQADVGVDVATVLDVFTRPEDTAEECRSAVGTTVRRVEEAASILSSRANPPALAAPVQGGLYPSLRREHARIYRERRLGDFYPIGGVVPLMEKYRLGELVDVIINSKLNLDHSKPVHLFGAGHPMVFALSTYLGCDFFDSSSYAKYAKDGRLMFPWGTEHLGRLSYLPCCCPVCSNTTVGELKAMSQPERERKIGLHNLHQCFAEIRAVKEATSQGSLFELVERRCSAHPALRDAFNRLLAYRNELAQFESTNRESAVLVIGEDVLKSPRYSMVQERLSNLTPPEQVERIAVIPYDEIEPPYFASLLRKTGPVPDHTWVFVHTPWGLIPIELDQIHPFSQSIFSGRDNFPDIFRTDPSASIQDYISRLKARTHALEEEKWIPMYPFLKDLEVVATSLSQYIEYTRRWKEGGGDTGSMIGGLRGSSWATYLDRQRRFLSTLQYQFGTNAVLPFLKNDMKEMEKVEFIISRNTGRIRNILYEGRHIASINVNTGLLTLKFCGGELLINYCNRGRVRVSEDSALFNRQGRSVFARFVIDASPGIRPGDEVFVVSPENQLVAVGQAMLSSREMADFKNGVAVKVREGADRRQQEEAS